MWGSIIEQERSQTTFDEQKGTKETNHLNTGHQSAAPLSDDINAVTNAWHFAGEGCRNTGISELDNRWISSVHFFQLRRETCGRTFNAPVFHHFGLYLPCFCKFIIHKFLHHLELSPGFAFGFQFGHSFRHASLFVCHFGLLFRLQFCLGHFGPVDGILLIVSLDCHFTSLDLIQLDQIFFFNQIGVFGWVDAQSFDLLLDHKHGQLSQLIQVFLANDSCDLRLVFVGWVRGVVLLVGSINVDVSKSR